MSCVADPRVGVAIRLADYLDCSARTLGEQGFQAVAGQVVGTGLLSGLVTIFVALIGYRLLLGHMPDLRDGVTWAFRLGIVLTLVTGWPAFQTLAYRVVVDGPSETAAFMLPAAGISLEQLDGRVQGAYDAMRLGMSATPASFNEDLAPVAGRAGPSATTSTPPFSQTALPQTASLLVIATSGVIGAMRLTAGFLLAVAPLAFLGLLFDATSTLVGSWIRAVGGSALGVLAATIVTGLEISVVENEIAGRALYGPAAAQGLADPQALTVIVLFFTVVMLSAVIAANRMVGALRLPRLRPNGPAVQARDGSVVPMLTREPVPAWSAGHSSAATHAVRSRAAGVAEALSTTMTRERLASSIAGGSVSSPLAGGTAASRAQDAAPADNAVSPNLGRRTLRRRTRSAASRDRVG